MLCGAFSRQELVDGSARYPSLEMCRATYYKSRDEFMVLQDEGQLESTTWSRVRFDKAKVDGAVEQILAFDNVSYLSWGTRIIHLDGAKRDVPCILRKKPTSVVYDAYIATTEPSECVSKSSFYRLSRVLTSGKIMARRSIDYVAGYLVYDTFDQLKMIVEALFPNEKDDDTGRFNVLVAWLKYAHATPSRGTNCPRHDSEYGLSPPVADGGGRIADCVECRSVHLLFASLLGRIRAVHADASAVTVVKDVYHKVQLFMGHRLRVVNQQRALESIASAYASSASDTIDSALIIIDFKMKAEPQYFRETTSAHFGKRGMSWHGVLVRYWERVRVAVDAESQIVERRLYYDHVSSGDNKQDKGAVLSMLEAAMIAIKRDFPDVARITVQSDNASSYQNAAVILLLPIIGAMYGIRVERYVHSETQDGKSMLDAHFAIAWRKILRYVDQGFDCVAPSQIVFALRADNGMPNCLPDLIEYDRRAIDILLQRTAATEAKFTKLVERANEVIYYLDPADLPSGRFDISRCPDFKLRIFSYSAVGEGDVLEVSFAKNQCTRHHSSPFAPVHVTDGHSDPLPVGLQDIVDVERDAAFFAGDGGDFADDADIAVEDPQQGGELSIECVPHIHEIGRVTNVNITLEQQLRRRVRKWKRVVAGPDQSASSTVASRALTGISRDRDIVSYAMRYLLALKGSGEVRFVEVSGLPRELNRVAANIVNDLDDFPIPVLSAGWARRPPRGKMYGAKYVHLYQADIKDMFDRGATTSSNKLGAGRMLEELRAQYPGRFNLPTESEIRAEISKLFAASKKPKSKDTLPNRVAKFRMPEEVSSFLTALVQREDVMPMAAVPMVREAFPRSEDDIPDDKIRSKVSTLRRAKQTNLRSFG